MAPDPLQSAHHQRMDLGRAIPARTVAIGARHGQVAGFVAAALRAPVKMLDGGHARLKGELAGKRAVRRNIPAGAQQRFLPFQPGEPGVAVAVDAAIPLRRGQPREAAWRPGVVRVALQCTRGLTFAADAGHNPTIMSGHPQPLPHYPTPAAERADLVVHLAGLVLAVVGGAIMLLLARGLGSAHAIAIGIYAGGFVLMLSFSLAYNFSDATRRAFFRRLDHSGIFLMIAGSYTPFTALALRGAWSWGMTTAVWAIASAGIAGKLFLPEMRESMGTALYIALGWLMLVAIGPIAEALPRPAMLLLVAGGLIYSFGVVFHVKEHLQFSRSIWHGHVLAGASAHWAAILIGTVLSR